MNEHDATMGRRSRGAVRWFLFVVLAALRAPTGIAQDVVVLDDTWTIVVNGRLARVRDDGSFRVSNVSAVDVDPLDFIADDWVQVVGVRTIDGRTQWATSDKFRIVQGQSVRTPPLRVTDVVPPTLAVRVRASVDATRLSPESPETRLRVFAQYSDGREAEIDDPASCVMLRSSRPETVSLERDGRVIARSVGACVPDGKFRRRDRRRPGRIGRACLDGDRRLGRVRRWPAGRRR